MIEQMQPAVMVLETGSRRLRVGQRYPMRMLMDMAERRFKASGRVLYRLAPENGFAGLHAGPGVGAERTDDGLALPATGEPVRLELPAVEEAGEVLPLVMVDITVPQDRRIKLSWTRQSLTPWEERLPTSLSTGLEAGRRQVYFSLRDPAVSGPLELALDRGAGACVLHAVEIRGVPR
jgi:hypothetical protein